jgi:uncharacterized membrane protein
MLAASSVAPDMVRQIPVIALLGVLLAACGGEAADGQPCESAGACEASSSCDTNPAAPECGPAVQLLDLPDGFPHCFASGASADGAIIVGACSNDESTRSVRWQRSGAATLLDIEGHTLANAVSADGAVTVGSFGPSGDAGYRYDADSSGTVAVSQVSVPLGDASDDGSVVVGIALGEPGNWDAAYGVRGSVDRLEQLAQLAPGQPTIVYGVSGDGRVSVGYAHDPDGVKHAAYWSEDGALHLLEAFSGATHSVAVSANRDGTVVVGTVYLDTNAELGYPVRWTEAGIERLGDDYGYGIDVSADGSRVLLQHSPPDIYESIWENGATQDVPTWLSAADFGRPESQPIGSLGLTGITRDGRSGFGVFSADDTSRAFILRLPE